MGRIKDRALLAVAVFALSSPARVEAKPPPNVFVPAGSMSVARAGATATLLRDGDVLVAGGGTATAELYDPRSATFTPTGSMSVARTDATATLLPDGKVLLAGGCCNLSSAELYDPATGTWSRTGSMNVARSSFTATLLPDGDVLVAGGACNGTGWGCDAGSYLQNLASAELYHPATGRWTMTGSMAYGREYHTATLLPSGKVLVVGGLNNCDDGFCSDLNAAELYDPATRTWSLTGSMNEPREQFSATLLANGQLLVAGGYVQQGISCNVGYTSSAELYDPATGAWRYTRSMGEARFGQVAARLHNGWVLVAGGEGASAELYEPGLRVWAVPGAMSTPRSGDTATLLPDGQVLVAGGQGPDGQPQATAELYTAGRGPLVSISPSSLAFGDQQVGTTGVARSFTVTNYGSADLSVAGVSVSGNNPGDFLGSTDCTAAPVPPVRTCTVSVRFAPTSTSLRQAVVAVVDDAPRTPQGVAVSGYGGGPNTIVPTAPMVSARDSFAAVTLLDGKVLIAGGQDPISDSLASAELYDPTTGRFTPTGSMMVARASPAAVRLPDGKVLVAGGFASDFSSYASTELFDPSTGTWTPTGSMNVAGYGLNATLLPNGKVLVTNFSASPAQLYDPTTGTWSNTGPVPARQDFDSATLLRDGDVLVVGDSPFSARALGKGGASTDAALYHPASNTWTATGPLNVPRSAPAAVLLADGQVLVTGGNSHPTAGGPPLASAELYHPASGKWTLTTSMSVGRSGLTATLLPNGAVLAAGGCTGLCNGGLRSTELYKNGFWIAGPPMTSSRVFASAAVLPSGDVLIAGGDSAYDGTPLASADLYTPAVLRVSPARGPVGQAIELTGNGFYAGERVTVRWDDGSSIATATTTDVGTFEVAATVPTSSAGPHTLRVTGQRSHATATTGFDVTPMSRRRGPAR